LDHYEVRSYVGWHHHMTLSLLALWFLSLERVAMGDAEAKPLELARGVKSFEFDPRDPGRLLLTWQRPELVALDFGVWRDGKLAQVDRGALPGSIRFLGPDSKRLAFAVVQPKRAGAYIAVPAE
jgi:hypothetical protein